MVEIQAESRLKEWINPFGMKSITFEKMKLNTAYRKKRHLKKLYMGGKIKLGLRGFARTRTIKFNLQYYGRELVTDLSFTYDIRNPKKSKFFANFSDITIPKLLGAFYINVPLPNVLYNTFFPHGLVISHE